MRSTRKRKGLALGVLSAALVVTPTFAAPLQANETRGSTTLKEIGSVRVSPFCAAVKKLGKAITIATADDGVFNYSDRVIRSMDYNSTAQIHMGSLRISQLSQGVVSNVEAFSDVLTMFYNESKAPHTERPDAAVAARVSEKFQQLLIAQKSELNLLTGFVATSEMIEEMREMGGVGVSGIGKGTPPSLMSSLPKGSLQELIVLRSRTHIELSELQRAGLADEKDLSPLLDRLAQVCLTTK